MVAKSTSYGGYTSSLARHRIMMEGQIKRLESEVEELIREVKWKKQILHDKSQELKRFKEGV